MPTTAETSRTRPTDARRRPTPSIREVCLLGPGRTLAAPAQGSSVRLHGRRYEVAADGPPDPDGAPPRYLHLHPAPGVANRPR